MDTSLGGLWKLVTGRPGVLQFMWSQKIGHDWATELNILLQIVYFLLGAELQAQILLMTKMHNIEIKEIIVQVWRMI